MCRTHSEAPQPPTCPVGFERVPDVAVEVIVTRQQEAPALGEGDGGDPADDVVVGVGHELLVRAEVEQPAGGVVGAGGKGVAVGEELEGESKPRVCKGTKIKYWNATCPRAGLWPPRDKSEHGLGIGGSWRTTQQGPGGQVPFCAFSQGDSEGARCRDGPWGRPGRDPPQPTRHICTAPLKARPRRKGSPCLQRLHTPCWRVSVLSAPHPEESPGPWGGSRPQGQRLHSCVSPWGTVRIRSRFQRQRRADTLGFDSGPRSFR